MANVPTRSNPYMFADHSYHLKQSDPQKSLRDEIRSIYQSCASDIERKTEDMVNSTLSSDEKALYLELRDNLPKYQKDHEKFGSTLGVNHYAIDRDPLLSKFQKHFQNAMMKEAIDRNGSGFFKNASYTGLGSTPQFMIRAISYIYPLLIIQPLPALTWAEDWPVYRNSNWAAYDVFLTATRIYNPTVVSDQGNDSGRVNATFGESVFQNITVRQDIIWDSTPEMYADESMNNGLVSYVMMEALKRGFDEQINDMYLNGNTANGITGLLTNTNITRINSGGSWAAVNSSTGEKYSTTDLINICSQVEQQSKGVYTAKKIMMSLKLKPLAIQPRSAYTSTTPIGFTAASKWGNDFNTMLESARYNPYLDNKATTSNQQIAVAYDSDMSMAHIAVPMFMFAEPLTYESHKFKIPFLTRTGGFRVLQAPSIAILDNIATT